MRQSLGRTCHDAAPSEQQDIVVQSKNFCRGDGTLKRFLKFMVTASGLTMFARSPRLRPVDWNMVHVKQDRRLGISGSCIVGA